MYWLKRKLRKINWSLIANLNGYVLICLGLLMVLPTICSLIYKEDVVYDFLITIAICLVVGFGLSKIKRSRRDFFARDGMIAVGLCWITASLFGGLPYFISQEMWIVSLKLSLDLLRPDPQSFRMLRRYQKESYFGEALLTGSAEWESWFLFKPLFRKRMNAPCISFEPSRQGPSLEN